MPNTSDPLVSPPLSDMAMVDHANHIDPAGMDQTPEREALDGELILELKSDEPKDGTLRVTFKQDMMEETECVVPVNADVRLTTRANLDLNTDNFEVLHGPVTIPDGTFQENEIGHDATLFVVVDEDAKLCEELGVSQIDQRKEWPGFGTGTALMFHAYENDDTMVGRIIQAGAEIDAKDPSCCNNTALHYAAEKNSAASAALLVRHGAQVDPEDDDGYTPLIVASERGSTEVAELLLAHGAQVDHKNKCGNTALFLARSEGHTRIAALLVEAGARQ